MSSITASCALAGMRPWGMPLPANCVNWAFGLEVTSKMEEGGREGEEDGFHSSPTGALEDDVMSVLVLAGSCGGGGKSISAGSARYRRLGPGGSIGWSGSLPTNECHLCMERKADQY